MNQEFKVGDVITIIANVKSPHNSNVSWENRKTVILDIKDGKYKVTIDNASSYLHKNFIEKYTDKITYTDNEFAICPKCSLQHDVINSPYFFNHSDVEDFECSCGTKFNIKIETKYTITTMEK